MEQSFYAGDAIRIEAVIRDSDDALMDPGTSTKLTLTGPTAVIEVNGLDMTRESIGNYYHIWQSVAASPCGVYRTKVVAISGGYTAVVHPSLFEVKESGI